MSRIFAIPQFWSCELHGVGPFYGGNLEVRGFSSELCRLVLDLARAGPFSVSHDGDSSAVILVGEDQRAALPADIADDPKVMVCSTPEELEAALSGGFDGWREFRDIARGRSPDADSADEPGADPTVSPSGEEPEPEPRA